MAGVSSTKASLVRVGTIAVLVAFMFVQRPEYLSQRCFLTAVTHHLWHANWFHLAANSLAIWLVLGRKGAMSELVRALALASLSYIAATKPCIGFSNVLFALAGMRAAHYGRNQWRDPNTIAFIVTMLAMLLIPSFSSTTHIVAFVLGLVAERTDCAIREAWDVSKQIDRQ